MMELRTVYPYGLNDRVVDEYKTANTHINVANKFPSLPRKYIRANRGTLHKCISKFLPNEFISELSDILESSIIYAPNFIRVSLYSMKKRDLKIFHQLLNAKLSNEFSDFLFSKYLHQCVDIIESKLYKPFALKLKKKPPENICNIFIDNKGVELINIARILRDPEISSALPKSIEFPTPLVTYKLGLPLSTKIFNLNPFVNTFELDEFLLNPNILPCKCINSPFADKYHKHVVAGDLRIIGNYHLRKLFTKGHTFRETKTINLEKAKSCILSGLNEYRKSFFSEWTNNIKNKINNRIEVLNNTLHKYKQSDELSSPDIRAAL